MGVVDDICEGKHLKYAQMTSLANLPHVGTKKLFLLISNSVRGEHETDITKLKDKDKDF